MNEISVDTFDYTSNQYNVHITLFFYTTHNLPKLPLQAHLVSSYDILDELSGITGCGPPLPFTFSHLRVRTPRRVLTITFNLYKNQSELCTPTL